MSLVARSDADEGEYDRCFVARFAAAHLTIDHDEEPFGVVARVVEALEADPRVVSVEERPFDEDLVRSGIVYIAAQEMDDEDELLQGVHYHTIEIPIPLRLIVRVPEKNQKSFFPGDEIPSDTYFAAWDGTQALVLWEQADADPTPMAGGHVVLDVLAEACERADVGYYHQSLCEPGCHYLFGHASLRAVPAMIDEPEFEAVEDDEVLVRLPSDLNFEADDALSSIARVLRTPLGYFSEMKNKQQHILETSVRIQRNLDAILARYYELQARRLQRPLRRLVSLRSARRTKLEARRILARLWQLMSHLEYSRQKWERVRVQFNEQIQGPIRELFHEQYDEMVEIMSTVDVALVRSAAGDLAGRFDTRDVIVASATAALVGGVAGLIGGIVA